LSSRYADDVVRAFRSCSEAEWLYQGLPRRLGKCTLEIVPEKTHLRRCSRFHPDLTRRVT
jgi:RNA-directed DNA polymerase